MCRNSLDRSAVDQPEVFKTFEALSIYSLSELLGTKVLKVLAIHCKLFFFQAAMDAESVASSTSFESLNIHANRQCVGKTKKTFFFLFHRRLPKHACVHLLSFHTPAHTEDSRSEQAPAARADLLVVLLQLSPADSEPR